MGPLGVGAATKLVANATLVGTITLLGETWRSPTRSGFRREVAFRVLASTPLAAQVASDAASRSTTGEFPLRFDLALARKDAELVSEAAGPGSVDVARPRRGRGMVRRG